MQIRKKKIKKVCYTVAEYAPAAIMAKYRRLFTYENRLKYLILPGNRRLNFRKWKQ